MPEPRFKRRVSSTKAVLFLTCLASLFLTHCNDLDLDPGQVLIRVQEVDRPDVRFRVLLENPDIINEADQLRRTGEARWIIGRVRRGDGGFNGPWSWHLDPSDHISFGEVTIEECQTTPGYIEENLDAWLSRTGLTCLGVFVLSP